MENCKFCGKECKNENSLRNHERLCHSNPERQISYGNHGKMPEHTKAYYRSKLKAKNGDTVNITRHQLDVYMQEHHRCEICGQTIEESNKWESKFAPKHLCMDHDHDTGEFRGVLCSRCNRQLGWYEKYKNEIENYLSKNKDGMLVQ